MIGTKSTVKSFAENHNKLILKPLENSQMASWPESKLRVSDTEPFLL